MNGRAKTLAILVALATAASAVYGFFVSQGDPRGALNGIAAGFPISLAIGAFEAYVVDGKGGRALRVLPFAAAVFVRFLAWSAAIVAGLSFMRWLLPYPEARNPDGFLADTAFAFALIGVAISYLAIDRLLGRGNLLRLLAGRYHRPREEDRVFLFLDMEGSTRAAETLGAVRFLDLLAATVLEATPPLLDARGEIHRYFGDEIVVTWPGARAEAALAGAIATLEALDAAAPRLRAKFGVAPRWRGGLHAGVVAAGEIGDARREIVFLGDTVNVAKRLETAARDLGKRLIVSDVLAERIVDRALRARLTDIGDIALAGKAARLRVHAVAVATTPRA